jgi:hypothetical protein
MGLFDKSSESPGIGLSRKAKWFNIGYPPPKELPFLPIPPGHLMVTHSHLRLIHHLRFQRSPCPMEWSLACPAILVVE